MQGIKQILAKYQTGPSTHDTTANYPTGHSQPVSCPVCQDRGIVLEGNVARPCQCMQQKELLNKFRYARISNEMKRQTFATFNLRYYSRALIDEEKNRSYYETAQTALKGAQEFVNEYVKCGTSLGLMFTGPVGSGKTFLACAIANALVEQDKQVLFLIVPDLLDELRATFNRKDPNESSEQDLLDTARTVPVLILDDLGAHNYTDWTRNRIFSIVNYRMNYNLPTVITTNLDIYELGEYLGERTSSRLLQMCRVFRLFVEQDIRLLNYLERESKR